jgi:hypothetical protein
MTGVNAVIVEGADSRRMRVALEDIARTPAPVTPSGMGVVALHISIQTNRQLPRHLAQPVTAVRHCCPNTDPTWSLPRFLAVSPSLRYKSCT